MPTNIYFIHGIFLLYTVCMSGQLFWTERQFYSKDFRIISVSFKIAIVRTKISSDKHVSLSFSLVMVFKKEEKIDGFFCFWLNSPHHLPVFWLTYLFNNFCHFWWFLKVLNSIDETLFVKGITDHPLRRRVNSACWTMIMLLMNVQQLK